MFPVGDFSYVVYPEFAVIALFIGAITGSLVSIILKLRVRGSAIVKDALVGASGAVITVYVLGHLEFESGFIAAIIVTVVLPILHELFRFNRAVSERR